MKLYVDHIKVHDQVLLEFQKEISNSKKLSTACKEFEVNKALMLLICISLQISQTFARC